MVAQPTASRNPEVQKHYAAQFALSTALAAALRRLWPVLRPGDVQATLPAYKYGVTALVDQYGAASSQLAADHFAAMRADAGVHDPFSPPLTDVLPAEKVQASLGWATDPVISGGDASAHEPISADTVTITFDRVEAAAQKLVADAGRNELIAAIEADRKVRGWARVTRDGACYFCRMLATRPILAGTLYHTRGTAGANANKRFVGTGDFKFHNNCHCTIEPVFSAHYEASAQARADAALWQDATAGLSGQAAINAFRRALYAQQRDA
jgi:hypothetical protein